MPDGDRQAFLVFSPLSGARRNWSACSRSTDSSRWYFSRPPPTRCSTLLRTHTHESSPAPWHPPSPPPPRNHPSSASGAATGSSRIERRGRARAFGAAALLLSPLPAPRTRAGCYWTGRFRGTAFKSQQRVPLTQAPTPMPAPPAPSGLVCAEPEACPLFPSHASPLPLRNTGVISD